MPKAGETGRGNINTMGTGMGGGMGTGAERAGTATAEAGGTFTQDITDRASGVVRNIRDRATDVTGRARNYASETYNTLNRTVHENPGNSVMVSFGVGALMGALVTFLIMNQSSDYGT